jgi:hypothetical protein
LLWCFAKQCDTTFFSSSRSSPTHRMRRWKELTHSCSSKRT